MKREDIKVGYKFHYANDAYEVIKVDSIEEMIYIKDLSDYMSKYSNPICFTSEAFVELCDARLIVQISNIWLDLEKRLQDASI